VTCRKKNHSSRVHGAAEYSRWTVTETMPIAKSSTSEKAAYARLGLCGKSLSCCAQSQCMETHGENPCRSNAFFRSLRRWQQCIENDPETDWLASRKNFGGSDWRGHFATAADPHGWGRVLVPADDRVLFVTRDFLFLLLRIDELMPYCPPGIKPSYDRVRLHGSSVSESDFSFLNGL
jgi:hypothetical protein